MGKRPGLDQEGDRRPVVDRLRELLDHVLGDDENVAFSPDCVGDIATEMVGNLEPGTMTFPLVRNVVDRVVTISEEELGRAMKGLATEERLIVEGAGATATAAILAGKASSPGQRVISLVTGGNVDLPKWLFTIS